MRLLQRLCLAVIPVGLSLLAVSCSSVGTRYRVIDVISDTPAGQNYDVVMNGDIVSPTGGIGFPNQVPSTGYNGISSGGNSIEIFPTGTEINGVNGPPFIAATSLNLAQNTQYTLLMTGRYASTAFPPAVVELTDNNTVPKSGTGEIRIVNASPGSPEYNQTPTIDIYIVAQGTTCPGNVPVAVSGLEYGQASGYQSESAPSGSGQGYTVCATPHNSTIPFSKGNPTLSDGEIITLIFVDNPQTNQLSSNPLTFTDLK